MSSGAIDRTARVPALVLAGGRSTRFESGDKALADLAGVPMIRRVADRLAPAIDRLLVNCRADQRERIETALSAFPRPVAFAIDTDPDRGPMAGIRTGLEALAPGELVFVVGCDMPLADPTLARYLTERASDRDGAVPVLADGWYQTTQAVYRAGPMKSACVAALARGERSVVAALSNLDHAVVDEEIIAKYATLGTETFTNVNTTAELGRVARRFEGN